MRKGDRKKALRLKMDEEESLSRRRGIGKRRFPRERYSYGQDYAMVAMFCQPVSVLSLICQ